MTTASSECLNKPVMSAERRALEIAVKAIDMAESRFADLGRVIKEHGSYDRAEFFEKSAERMRNAIADIRALVPTAGEAP